MFGIRIQKLNTNKFLNVRELHLDVDQLFNIPVRLTLSY